MAKFVVEEAPDFAVLPAESIIFVKIESIEDREVPGRDGKPGWTKLEFTFVITGIQILGDGSTDHSPYESLIGSKIWGSVSARLTDHPENRLKQWGEAILGMEFPVGFELDTDYLVGRAARAVTSVYNKKTVNPTTGQPYQQHQISSLLPIGNAAQPQPQANAGWGAGSNGWATPGQVQQPVAQPAPQPVAAQQTVADPWASFPSEPPF